MIGPLQNIIDGKDDQDPTDNTNIFALPPLGLINSEANVEVFSSLFRFLYEFSTFDSIELLMLCEIFMS